MAGYYDYELWARIEALNEIRPKPKRKIKNVIFNPPATIVLWNDGTKTVVKAAEGDEYSKWAGLALCMAKKQLGEDFHKVFKEWCKEEAEEKQEGYTNPFLNALYHSVMSTYYSADSENKKTYSFTFTPKYKIGDLVKFRWLRDGVVEEVIEGYIADIAFVASQERMFYTIQKRHSLIKCFGVTEEDIIKKEENKK